MLRKNSKKPQSIVSFPLMLYGATAFLFSTGVLILFFDISEKVFVPLSAVGALTLVFGLMALSSTKSLTVEGDLLVVKNPFGKKRYSLEGATLSYRYTGTTRRPNYMLVLTRLNENPVRLLSLGVGMAMQKGIQKAQWVAQLFGVPFDVSPQIQQAAAIQGRSFSSALPVFFGIMGVMFVLGTLGVFLPKFFEGNSKKAKIRFVCQGTNTVEVDGLKYTKKDSFTVLVKPGIKTVRWKGPEGWRLYRIPMKKEEKFFFRCKKPPNEYQVSVNPTDGN